MDGMGEKLLSGGALSGQEDGGLCAGHAGGDLLGPQHDLALAHDVVKDIFGLVAPVIQLQPELPLAFLLLAEPLQQQKAADVLSLPVHRHGGKIQIGVS